MANFTQGYALVIGVANYPHVRPLPVTVLKDARDVAALLQQPDRAGYLPRNVKVLLDSQATKQAILDGLAWLASNAVGDAVAVVYFSGHGGRFEGGANHGNYLIPYDTQLSDIKNSAISSEEFTIALRAITADQLVVLLDACHSGGTGEPKGLDANEPVFKGGIEQRVYDQLAQGSGRAIFASSKPSEVSYVLPGAANSLFTAALLEALNGKARQRGDGTLRLFDIVEYVWDEVPRRHPQQHPIFKASDLDSNFPIALYLGGRKSLDAAPAMQPLQTAVDTSTLRDFIDQHTTFDDLELMCTDVQNEMTKDGMNLPNETFTIEVVPRGGKKITIARLIDWLRNRNRLAYLVRLMRKRFPGEL